MSMSTRPAIGAKSEPNVTPYIDILLVLLIIFMVIQPFKATGFDVKIPEEPPQGQDTPSPKGMVLSLDAQNTPFINKEPLTLATLGPRLTQIFNSRAEKNIFVKGDKNLAFGDVVRAIDIARGSGVEQIGLMTDLEVQ